MKIRIITKACAFLCVLFISSYVSAATQTYGFYKLTNNNAEDISSQLSITLWDANAANAEFSLGLAATDVLFTVQNNVGINSNIAEVYFDDGLLGDSVAHNSLGGSTSFTGGGASPGNLPSGNNASPPFVAYQQPGFRE